MANPEHVKLLLSGKKAVADWREEFCSTFETEHDGLDLRDASLEGINLIGYDLTGADLRNAKLSKARLSQANLIEADLRNADLSEANLYEAWCVGADFRRARLYRVWAQKADFLGADMREACLMCSYLGEALFENTNLEWANLIGADLHRTFFYNANLANAKLSGIVFDTEAIEEWNISNAKCYYYLRSDKERDRRERRAEREQARKERKLPPLISMVPNHYVRIPEKGYLKGNEFEDLFKARRSVEFLFEHGMNALDPAILGAAIDLANSEHPAKGFRFLSIDARGGIPRAVIEIADKVSKDDALRLVQACYEQAIEHMHKELEGLKRDKTSLLQMASRTTLLPALGTSPEPVKDRSQLNDAEQNIIEAVGEKMLIAEEVAKKAGYPCNSNFKSTLSSLRKRGILDNRFPKGYFLRPEYYFLLKIPDQSQD